MGSTRTVDAYCEVRRLFESAPFVCDLGIVVKHIEDGECESEMPILARHAQQNGVVHAGVLATIADHTAGGAAQTLCEPGHSVLSIEFKINLLRPARGEKLRCRATVLKHGKTIVVGESEVYAIDGDAQKLVCKATVTLTSVMWRD